jgi:predicted nuclease of predicted toxin-antitoxin system
LITKDRDFAEWAFCRTPRPQVVWLRSGNQPNHSLLERLDDRWPRILGGIAAGALVVEA